MNVLSLFDGISACHLALTKAGFEVSTYYTSEIDKYASQISEHHYPDAIRLGDVTKHDDWDIDWSSIDIVTGGFPCQAWSVAGKQLGDKDERGMLFWTMLDVMKKVLSANPEAIFLMENVKMKREFEEYITYHTKQALGDVEKILINSALVSAQNRNRYYWTNIQGIEQPEDKGLVLADVVEVINGDRPCELNGKKNHSGLCHEVATATDLKNAIESRKRVYSSTGKCPTLQAAMGMGGNTQPKILVEGPCELRGFNQDSLLHHVADATDIKGHGYNKRVYAETGKSPTLAANSGGNLEPKVLVVKEATKKGYVEIEPGQCVDMTFPKSKTRRGRKMENKSNCLTAASFDYGQWNGHTYRKLTPLECERLQTFPDGWTLITDENGKQLVSNSQRYKALGNAWTVDVIAHIFSYVKKQTGGS